MDPVSELSQYCEKKKIDYPKSAEPIKLPGNPIQWDWIFTRGVEGNMSAFSGRGSTKKEAKKRAAVKMLLALKAELGDTVEIPILPGRPLSVGERMKWENLTRLPPWKQDYFDNQYELLEHARNVMAIDRAQDKESCRVIQVLIRLIEGEEQMNQNIKLHRTTLEEHLERPAGKTGFIREVLTAQREE